jgi:tetratricopeptide (TPR) repeat protein
MKKLLYLVSVFCLWGIVSCVYSTEQQVTLQEGRRLEKNDKFFQAETLYQNMPGTDIRDDSQHNLQHLYGNIMDAMRMQQQNPASAKAQYALGKAYYKKAQTIPKTSVDVSPNLWFDLESYFAERRSHFQGNAQQALETANQLQTDYEEALLLEGIVHEEMGQPEKALPNYRRLQELYPDTAVPVYRLGLLLYERGETGEAIRLVEQATSTYPDDPNTHYVLGVLYAREHRYEQAIKEFERVLCINANYSEPYYNIAQIYLAENNLIDAERVLRMGLITHPESFKLAGFYGSVKSILDAQDDVEARFIAQRTPTASEGVAELTGVSSQTSELSPALQIRQATLYRRVLQRQQPYTPHCAEQEEDIYFSVQMAIFDEKIQSLTEMMASPE